MFINGSPEAPVTLGAISSPSGPKQIGATSTHIITPIQLTFYTDLFVGLIDEMHFYDRPLSAAEVALLANGGLCTTNGQSWATAFRFLECAYSATASGDEVWIGEGTYLPTAARQSSLDLEHDVTLYGGFLGLSPGGGETSRNQRPAFDPAAPLSVITGDMLGNDLPPDATPDPFANHTENIRILLRGDQFEDHKVDGLELRGGYANGASGTTNSGAAIHEDGVTLEMRNVVFRQNYALGTGGAISSTTVISASNLTFEGNVAELNGGGIATSKHLFLRSSTFLTNSTGILGGAILTRSNLHLYDVRFAGNYAASLTSEGGAVAINASSPFSATIRNSSFLHNTSKNSGAIVMDAPNGEPKSGVVLMENTLFANNNASANTGSLTAVDADDMRLFDVNVTLLHNTFFGPNALGPSIVTVRSTGEMRYNIFNSQQAALHASNDSSILEDFNLLVDSSFVTSSGGAVNSGGNSFSGAPHFVNEVGGDFHIGIASDARDGAAPSTAPLDFEGDERPGGLAPDIGYDEIPLALPSAHGGGPHTLNEGASLALDGSGSSDADNALVSYSWDCTNDGTFDQIGSSPTGNACPYADNGAFALRLLVEDATGYKDTHLSTVTVNNVAPTFVPATAQTATAGQSKAFTFGSFTDPGPDAPWEIRVNWGDGDADSVFNAGAVGAIAPQNHTFGAAGTRTVTVTVRDKDGGAQSKSFQVTVAGSGSSTPETPTPETPTPETPTPEGTQVFLPAVTGK